MLLKRKHLRRTLKHALVHHQTNFTILSVLNRIIKSFGKSDSKLTKYLVKTNKINIVQMLEKYKNMDIYKMAALVVKIKINLHGREL